jgi:hypothetical protein
MLMHHTLRRGLLSWHPWLCGLASGTFAQPCGIILQPRVRVYELVIRVVYIRTVFCESTYDHRFHSTESLRSR